MTGRALPVVIVGVACGLGALVLLARDAARWARALAVLAVAGLVVAWGVAQWPYLLPESLTVSQAAAPSGTLQVLVLAVVLAVLIVGPGFVLLYVLDPAGGAAGGRCAGRRRRGREQPRRLTSSRHFIFLG